MKIILIFFVSNSFSSHLAYISASESGKNLKISAGKPSGEHGTAYTITLSKPLSKTTVIVSATYTHMFEMYPEAVGQQENQFVRYQDNAYFWTPYTTKSQHTAFKLASKQVETHTHVTPSTAKGDVVSYGPYEDVAPFKSAPISIHYQNNKPFITITSLVKEIEVSHWGNVAVEETFELQHDGAKLKGTFSRYDYQRSQNTGSPSHIPEFTEYLPAAAADVYYRDSIGNITTSHLRDNLDSIELILQPRFPLFGGWKTAYYMGYNLPLPGILFLDNSDSSHYVLNISFGINFPDAVIDHYTVRIILPEGAKNIEFTTPFAIDKHSFDTHYTYLDTSGRPVLVLEKSNVVIEHNENFLVAYHFSTISMLQEPFLLVGAFFCFFLFVMIYIRFDFSIGESRKSDPHKHQIEVHLYELKEEIEKREEVHERVSKSYQKFFEKQKHQRI